MLVAVGDRGSNIGCWPMNRGISNRYPGCGRMVQASGLNGLEIQCRNFSFTADGDNDANGV
jgi:hypothetical protein